MLNNSILLWEPGTCGCRIHLAYDDKAEKPVLEYVTEKEAHRIHNGRIKSGEKNINENPQPPCRLCQAHTHHGQSQLLYNAIQVESEALGLSLGVIGETIPGMLDKDTTGNMPVSRITWSFDNDRKLHLSIAGIEIKLTQAQKSKLRAKLNSDSRTKDVFVHEGLNVF